MCIRDRDSTYYLHANDDAILVFGYQPRRSGRNALLSGGSFAAVTQSLLLQTYNTNTPRIVTSLMLIDDASAQKLSQL